MFYDSYLLKSPAPRGLRSLITEIPIVPNPEVIQRQISRYWGIEGVKNLSFSWQVHFFNNESKAIIQLWCQYETATDTRNVRIGEVTISTVEFNCGALHLGNLWIDTYYARDNNGVGTVVYNKAIEFAKTAGYSVIICNTAGQYQNQNAGRFFEKRGWIPLTDFCYVNKRSDNANIWYILYLDHVQRVSYDEALTNNFDSEDEDYDEHYEEEDY